MILSKQISDDRGNIYIKPSSIFKNNVVVPKESVRILKSNGTMNSDLPAKKLISNKSNSNINININTKIQASNAIKGKIYKPSLETNEFSIKMKPKIDNYSIKSNLGNKNLSKQQNYHPTKTALGNITNDNRSKSSVKLGGSSKPVSSHINKSNLNPNFNATPSKGFNAIDSDYRPIIARKSRLR